LKWDETPVALAHALAAILVKEDLNPSNLEKVLISALRFNLNLN